MLKTVINLCNDFLDLLRAIPTDAKEFAEDRTHFVQSLERLQSLRERLEKEEHDALQRIKKADETCKCTHCRTAAAVEALYGLTYEQLIAIVTAELQTDSDDSIVCTAPAASGVGESKVPDCVWVKIFFPRPEVENNMPVFADDYALGMAGEEYSKPHIEEYLGFPIVLSGGMNTLDVRRASDHKFIGEIKTRTCSSISFPDIVINKSKIDAFTDPERQYYCFFNLTDGLFAVPYDRERFETFSTAEFQRTRARSDYVDRVNTVYHIPTSELQLIVSKV